jgi:hypothetical protein
MRYRYYICGVFTGTRFGADRRAVLLPIHPTVTVTFEEKAGLARIQ